MKRFIIFLIIILIVPFFLGGMSGDGMRISKLIIKVVDYNSNMEVQNANVKVISLHSLDFNYHLNKNAIKNTDQDGKVTFFRRGGWGYESIGYWKKHGAGFEKMKLKITKDGYQDELFDIKEEHYEWYEVFGIDLGEPPKLFEYEAKIKYLAK